MKSFAQLGDELKNWGPTDNATSDEIIKGFFKTEDFRLQLSLLSAILIRLEALTAAVNQIPNAINRIPNAIARADRSEEKALEREKQKTAKAQLKVVEATPPTVTMVQMTNEEIQRAIGNGRTRRKF
jgi:hypothetical protein